ncbi:MAG: prolipoprotein diacylglyceryl transferase [Flavisolibacter sp.]|nr:prolipoprotein diacylglyceryl transferase [Flavisolibacter sp.]MBD0376720.1 prolipoprotein diacylglyceryl transferase [Flavisolibacter sp.]
MQFPVQLHLGSFTIPLHAVLETLGIFIGFRYFLFLRRKQSDPIESSNRIWIIIGALFGALFGSRLIGALEQPIAWQQSLHPLLYFYQNKTVVGGFLGGLAGVELIKKWIGEKKSSGDLFVSPLILALIIGRFGCFSMGVYEETYGLPTTLPWGMNLGDGMLRHPVTLYEILFLMLLWMVLYTIRKKIALENGALFKLFMIAYLFFRFLLDFIKPHYTFSFGLSTIQIACLAGLIYYLPYIIQPKKLTIAYA